MKRDEVNFSLILCLLTGWKVITIEIIVEAIVDGGGPAHLAQVLNVYEHKSPLTCQENYRVK